MLCFEVRVNGELAATAGVGEEGVLSAIVTWVKRSRQNCPEDTTEAAWCQEALDLSLGGIEGGTGQSVQWLRQALRRGDEVMIRVVERPSVDSPIARSASQPSESPNTFEEPNEEKIAVRSRQRDSSSGRSYELHLSDLIAGETPADESVDVELVFEDGCRYVASFFKDPQKGKGRKKRFFWDRDDMILVPELTSEILIEAVTTLVGQGNLDRAFRRVGE